MADLGLLHDKRILLHNYMIDFVIQKRNILDCYQLKTWEIFASVISPAFNFTARQFRLEFFCYLIPNLENYEFNDYYVNYFNKIRYMAGEERRKYLEKDEIVLKVIILEGEKIEYSFDRGRSQKQVKLPRHSGINLSPYSVAKLSQSLGYDSAFMRDSQIFFAHMTVFRSHINVPEFLRTFKLSWEIKTLLQLYPRQFVSEFMWWRRRLRDRQESQKRKKTSKAIISVPQSKKQKK